MTRAEIILWTRLRGKQIGGTKFRRQHPIGPYIADFASVSEMVVIEVDGWTHSTDEELSHDAWRTKFLENLGWTVIRIENSDIYDDEDRVLDYIANQMEG